jgi:undecaprenyl-diphosphatase
MNVNLESGPMVAFDVCLHMGTLVAVLAALRKDVWIIIKGLFDPARSTEETEGGFCTLLSRKTFLLVILGTIPAVIIGFSFKDFFEEMFSSRLAAGIALVITGSILFATRWAKVCNIRLARMKWFHAVVVGCAQALAIFPGISRSGSTISAGMFSRLDRTLAAKFSFLLSIPAIAGAAVLQYKNLAYLSANHILPVIIGTLVAAVVGYVCVKWIISLMRGNKFSLFAYYCWAVGLAVIVWSVVF